MGERRRVTTHPDVGQRLHDGDDLALLVEHQVKHRDVAFNIVDVGLLEVVAPRS